MSEQVEPAFDAFAPEAAPGVQLIVQMRIYDALMAVLTEISPDKAKALLEVHATGGLYGVSPGFNGTFITDQQIVQD